MTEKKLVLNNLLVTYYEQGNGTAPLIFLHGWRSEAAVWLPLFKSLYKIPYTLYAVDLPGFGKSETPKKPFILEDYADVVQEFVSKVIGQTSKVTLVGHSFGARVAIKCAATHPELIEKLVLVDSGGARMKSEKRKALKIVAKLAKLFFKPGFMQPLRKKIYERLGATDYVATPELQQTFLNIINEDLTPLFPKITAPTLIVWGEKDEETPLSYARIMHQTIPHSELVILPNAGHFSFLDNPEKFVQALTEFIK